MEQETEKLRADFKNQGGPTQKDPTKSPGLRHSLAAQLAIQEMRKICAEALLGPLSHLSPKLRENCARTTFAKFLQKKKVLPALLQKLVGEFFFDFSQGNLGNLVGILAGILRDFF